MSFTPKKIITHFYVELSAVLNIIFYLSITDWPAYSFTIWI